MSETQDSKAVDKLIRGIPILLGQWREKRGLTPNDVAREMRARGFSIGRSDVSRYETDGPKGYKHRSFKVVAGMLALYGRSLHDLAEGLTVLHRASFNEQHFEPLSGDPVKLVKRLEELEQTTVMGAMYARRFPKRRMPAHLRKLIRDFRARQVASELDLSGRWHEKSDSDFLAKLEKRLCTSYDVLSQGVLKFDRELDRPRDQVLQSYIDDWHALRIAAGLDEYASVNVDETIDFFDSLGRDVKQRDDQPVRITDQSLHPAHVRLSLGKVGELTISDDVVVIRHHPTMPMEMEFVDDSETINDSLTIFRELDRAAGHERSKKVTLEKLETLKFLTERRNILQDSIFRRFEKKGARPFDGPLKSPKGVTLTITEAAKVVGTRSGPE